MRVRRVVTGHAEDGTSIVVSDGEVEPTRVDLLPGYEFHRLWGADAPVHVPGGGTSDTTGQYFPAVGGFRFGVFTVPPDSTLAADEIDVSAALQQMEEAMAGMAGHMEPDNPGMHTTDTVDYEFVVSGRIVLELDDGVEVELGPGDTVVQNGTRHAWRNRGDVPCVMVLAVVGVERT